MGVTAKFSFHSFKSLPHRRLANENILPGPPDSHLGVGGQNRIFAL